MKVVVVNNEKQIQDAFNIRNIVFVEEQKVPLEEEIDQFEDVATHFVIYNDKNEAVGAGRFRDIDGYGKIERICVLPEYRKSGTGKLLMTEIIEYARDKQFTKVKLNSQNHAIPFYEKLGFKVCSEEFMDAGIPHKAMELHL